jgi:ATP-binding cassette subfamily F protein uup
VHVAGWAARFLFRNEQLETPVARLSGGEQARILLARLMLQPADLLILDEPTNDLDIPTLEVLEESLLAFSGALVLVTHDRYLLDRVSTQILALDGRGGVVPYADYTQWEIGQREDEAAAAAARTRGPASRAASPSPVAKPASKKLSYREQQEWDRMEAAIESAERAVAAAELAAGDPAVAADHRALSERIRALTDAQAEVERLYARWAELEAKVKG